MPVRQIHGKWRAGWSLDFHTISSHLLANGSFDTKRTEIGEMLYRLKYNCDGSQLKPLAQLAADFIKTRFIYPSLAAIVPIPASITKRDFQLVPELAAAIGQLINLRSPSDYLCKTRDTAPLKNIVDVQTRKRELAGSFEVRDARFENRWVLLFDDLFRSGETLSEATTMLHDQGKVGRVYVLTLTRTRVKI
ncbi:ComF family protein [bacterium]|nr:ComF family protein [bacterium]